jgi:hypothetical protein
MYVTIYLSKCDIISKISITFLESLLLSLTLLSTIFEFYILNRLLQQCYSSGDASGHASHATCLKISLVKLFSIELYFIFALLR